MEKKEEAEIEERESEAQENDNKKTSQVFYVLVALLVLAFLFIFSLKLFDRSQEFNNFQREYHNYNFINISGLWMTEIQNPKTGQIYQIPLHYGPWELENISIVGAVDPRFQTDEIYVTFDPNASSFAHLTIAASELSNNLVQVVKARVTAACTQNGTGCESRPVITCENTNETVIYLSQENSKPAVFLVGNCIVVEGQGYNIVRAAERLIYQFYDIMN